MDKKIFVDDPAVFQNLSERAAAGLRLIRRAPQDQLVFFDSAIVTTHHFFRVIRALQVSTKEEKDTFAFVGLRPDPVGYFFKHFSRFPAIVFRPADNEADYRTMLQTDPGGSPADALAFNTWAYAVFPQSGQWIAYGDDAKEVAAFSGTAEANAFVRTKLGRDVVHPASDFKLID